MMRSLYSGISGLKSLQSNMDVIGNNISNVNTTGYKAGRMTFKDALSQTMVGATRPGGLGEGVGGTNPIQIGLGTGIASVDTSFAQGNLQKTGNTTDLALQGSAFFVVANGTDKYFTRDGAFSLDANGHLVMPGNGLMLQGYNADDDGNIPVTAAQGDITIPYNTSAPAKATTEIDFARNLNADSNAMGSVSYSKQFLHPTDGGTPLTSLYDANGKSLQIQIGDTIEISMLNTAPTAVAVTAGTTLNSLAAQISAVTGRTVTVDAAGGTGQLRFAAGGPTVSQLQITTSRPGSDSLVANAFRFPTTILGADTPTSGDFLRPATGADLLSTVFDANGKPLGVDPANPGVAVGLQNGDKISLSGAVGGVVSAAGSLTYNQATTTMNDLVLSMQNQLHLPQTDGTDQNNPTVSLNASGANNNIPEGALVLRGLPGKSFELTDLSINAADIDNQAPTPSYFNSNLAFHDTQYARDAGAVNTSITAYDEKGFPHNVSVIFTKSQTPNQWYWQAQVAGSERIQGGGQGTLSFGSDGTVSSFSFADGSAKLMIDPNNGSNLMEVSLNPGSPGKFSGLTQFKAANTAAATNQDGHTMGSLQSISIGTDGVITGQFSNGVTRSLAQVEVADFTNPAGLTHESDSVYAQTANSGDPVFGRPGSQSTTTLQSGTLEMSNVDLAGQFTEMITTQRGYQANARIITTSDSMLQELVGLVR